MVRAWGPVADEHTLETLLPTLNSWVQQLGGEQWQAQGLGPSAGAGSGTSRPRFSPPASAVWRALHGLLPLVQGAAAQALLPALPGLAGAVLAGISGRAGAAPPEPPHERELCRWFAVGCWSHLLAAAGGAALDCLHLSADEVVQELVAAAAPGSGSERLQKAAAEAVAATLQHAAVRELALSEADAALRRGLLFLLHDIPLGAASGGPSGANRSQQPGVRGYSPLTVAVAEAAAFTALLQLLQRGGGSAAAALGCSHYWLPPLSASLRRQRAEQRSPALFAAADKAASRLAAACLAGEVAALGGAARCLPEAGDPAVAAVAAVAAQQAHRWQCLPALWHALVQAGSGSGSEAQEACALLLAAAAELAAAKERGGGAAAASLGAVPAVAGAFGAGFSASGLSSSLASDIEAAQRLPGLPELRGNLLDARECASVCDQWVCGKDCQVFSQRQPSAA